MVSNTYCVVFLCLFVYSGVQHILCCVFALVFFVLCTPMLPVSLGCVVFLLWFSSSCVPYVTSFSRLCCVFVLFIFVLCTPMLPVSLECVFFLLSFQYSLTFIMKFSPRNI